MRTRSRLALSLLATHLLAPSLLSGCAIPVGNDATASDKEVLPERHSAFEAGVLTTPSDLGTQDFSWGAYPFHRWTVQDGSQNGGPPMLLRLRITAQGFTPVLRVRTQIWRESSNDWKTATFWLRPSAFEAGEYEAYLQLSRDWSRPVQRFGVKIDVMSAEVATAMWEGKRGPDLPPVAAEDGEEVPRYTLEVLPIAGLGELDTPVECGEDCASLPVTFESADSPAVRVRFDEETYVTWGRLTLKADEGSVARVKRIGLTTDSGAGSDLGRWYYYADANTEDQEPLTMPLLIGQRVRQMDVELEAACRGLFCTPTFTLEPIHLRGLNPAEAVDRPWCDLRAVPDEGPAWDCVMSPGASDAPEATRQTPQ